jgi:diadenosine tetraphosphate (Ap4A) HIT family hydrolase
MTDLACPLCATLGGVLVFQGTQCRVIRAQEAGFPAFYRVIWTAHIAEFSDLSAVDQHACMGVVAAVEQVLRTHLKPTKINLAALGNMVPHLHWHVIARFAWDSHFPAPVWAAAQRPVDPAALAELEQQLAGVDMAIQRHLAQATTAVEI